ncbi:hypothetical protein EMCRGX_G034111 [Ephydatia muelleri]|eukprot:Em0023g22a
MAGAGKVTSEFLKNAVVLTPTAKHTATLFFFHGLGDTGHGWAATFEDIKQPHVRLVCPNAPTMPVTLNKGYKMPSWFDLFDLGHVVDAKEDEAGILQATSKVHQMLDEELNTTGISSDKIVLGGFSQGGALALFSALTYDKPLGGIVALSSWLPLHALLPKRMTPQNKNIQCLICHGEDDSMVNFKYGKLTYQFISGFNSSNVQFKAYRGLDHSSCPQEVSDIEQWLHRVIPPSGGSM